MNNIYYENEITEVCLFHPTFHQSNTVVVFVCAQGEAALLAVSLQSILDFQSIENNYDIIILYDELTYNDRYMLLSMVDGFENISLRLQRLTPYDISERCKMGNKYRLVDYFKCFLPIIIRNFKKILYLGNGSVMIQDVSKLFHMDLHGCPVGGFRSTCCNAFNAELLVIHPQQFQEEYNINQMAEMLLKMEKNSISIYNFYHMLCIQKCYLFEQKHDDYFLPFSNNIAKFTPEDIDTHVFWKTAKSTPYFEMLLYEMYHGKSEMLLYSYKPRHYNYQAKFSSKKSGYYLFPFEMIEKGSRIIIYGAGVVGQSYWQQVMLSNYCDIVFFVDKNYLQFELNRPFEVRSVDELVNYEFNYILIAVNAQAHINEIKTALDTKNIPEQKIVVPAKRYLECIN